MSSLHHGSQSVCSVDDTYDLYAKKEFKSPHRSTIPLLSWLKHEETAVGKLLDEFGISRTCSLHLEYGVNCPLDNKPTSQTDLMVLSEITSLAIECKWTEPVKTTAEEWYDEVDEENGPLVLQGWLQLLQRVAEPTLLHAHFSQVVNQMIHRAASACLAGQQPQLVYLIFRPSMFDFTTNKRVIRDELAHLWRVLGRPKDFPFSIVEIDIKYTSQYEPLAKLPKNSDETAAKVKEALLSSKRLFEFGKPMIERLS